MSHILPSPSIPSAPPPPPTVVSPSSIQAGQQAGAGAAAASGYQSTILTSGQGVLQPPSVGRRALLGG